MSDRDVSSREMHVLYTSTQAHRHSSTVHMHTYMYAHIYAQHTCTHAHTYMYAQHTCIFHSRSLNHNPLTTGPVTRKLVRAKSGPGRPLLAAKIGPTPDHFWLPKMVRVAKSGPGISACTKPFLAFRRLCRTHFYSYMQPQ